MKIVDYKIVSSTFCVSDRSNQIIGSILETISLEVEVKKYLKEGWHLYGHPFMSIGAEKQAMVKYEDENVEDKSVKYMEGLGKVKLLDSGKTDLNSRQNEHYHSVFTENNATDGYGPCALCDVIFGK